jgi:hypothetical protein
MGIAWHRVGHVEVGATAPLLHVLQGKLLIFRYSVLLDVPKLGLQVPLDPTHLRLERLLLLRDLSKFLHEPHPLVLQLSKPHLTSAEQW